MSNMSRTFIWNTSSVSGNTDVTESELNEYLGEGCAFLPAAGYYYGSSWYEVGSNGYYWSATESNASSGYFLYFDSSDVSSSDDIPKSSNYFPLRLVREI